MNIQNSADAIEGYLSAHLMLIEATGHTPTREQADQYRQALRVLCRLAVNEYARDVAADTMAASAALRGKL